jgi:hypothetical protein
MASSTREVIQTTLAAALAGSGTLTLSYPAGTNAGSFQGATTHRVVSGTNDIYKSPKYFTLSFGATSITLTWDASAPTLPVNTKLFIQLDRAGSKPQSATENRKPGLNSAAGLSLKLISLGAPTLAATNNIAASQSVAAAASFSLNGSLLSAVVTGKVILDVPRNVVAAWTTTSVLTITGKDEYGNTMVETSASGTSHTGKKAFKEITSVSSSASITSATIGTGTVLGLPVFVPTAASVVDELENGNPIDPPARVSLPFQINQTDLLAPTVLDMVSPVAGYLDTLRGVAQVAVTTGGTIQAKINTVSVTGMLITVANSDAKGTAYSGTPTTKRSATTIVAKGDRISLTPASFATAGAINGELEIETFGYQGAVVAGKLDARQSGTTGDVRGTYSPRTAPDGSTYYALVLRLADPDFLGDDQYAG